MARPSRATPPTTLRRLSGLPGDALRRYTKLGARGKAAIWLAVLSNVLILIAVIIITPSRIGRWFNQVALGLRGLGVGGMFLEGLFVVLASHPPLFGFAASMTLIGFTYGVWPGFLIAFLASMTGAGIAFLSVRAFFLKWVRSKSNDKWDAFGHVMAQKGLPLVIMIRYCPIPWAVGNGLFASIESVKFWHFLLANLLMQPRLMIPVFIGSRLTSLASETPSHDPLRFWINLGSICLSMLISVSTGIWIYRLTLAQMRKLDRSGAGLGDGELAAEALEEGALLGDYSGDEEPLTDRGEVLRPGQGMARRTSSSGNER